MIPLGLGTVTFIPILALQRLFLKARYYDSTWFGDCDFHSHSGSSKAFSLSTAAARGFLASTPLEGGVVRLVAPLWCSVTFPLLSMVFPLLSLSEFKSTLVTLAL